MKDKSVPVQVNVIQHRKLSSKTLIRVTVRSLKNDTRRKKHKSIDSNISVNVIIHHTQEKSRQPSSIQTHVKHPKIATNSVKVSRIHRLQRSPIQPIQNKPNNDSLTKYFQEECIPSINQGSKMIKDRTDVTKNYHKKLKRNKKKKCSRQCIIFTALIIAIIITILLTILLIKFKQTIKTETTENLLLRWNSTGITIAGVSNISGNDNTHLNTPWDLTLDYKNSLYIADRGNNRIQKYLADSPNASTVAGLANGTTGSSFDRLSIPPHIIVDTSGNMHITDSGNQRILSWLNDASSGTIVAGTGIAGNSSNQLYTPYGIERDLNSGTLYIGDYSNHRVMSYLKGASSGTVFAGGNGPGTNPTQLMAPVGLYFDSLSNSLIIANHGAHNIVRWFVGENHWTLLAGSINGTAGNTTTLLFGVTDMTLDPMGNMYVADRNNHRIQLFMAGQSNGITIAGVAGVYGSEAGLLRRPWSVKLDSQLNLYVADADNHRIQKFLRY